MESNKRKRPEEDQQMEDDDWEDVQEEKPRKIIKAKRQVKNEEGDQPGDISFEDSDVDEFEEENVVQRNSDDEWSDEDEEKP